MAVDQSKLPHSCKICYSSSTSVKISVIYNARAYSILKSCIEKESEGPSLRLQKNFQYVILLQKRSVVVSLTGFFDNFHGIEVSNVSLSTYHFSLHSFSVQPHLFPSNSSLITHSFMTNFKDHYTMHCGSQYQ